MQLDIMIGFSTGCFYKSLGMLDSLDLLRSKRIKAVELNFIKGVRGTPINQLDALHFHGFDYVSLHAPIQTYGHNKETEETFAAINVLHTKRPLDLVVFHPDTVSDFSVFKGLDFPVAFENMDNRKTGFKTPSDLWPLLSKDPKLSLVLDVNHAFTNDSTLKLVDMFYNEMCVFIAQIHLSGYRNGHQPLFQTRQKEIIKSIPTPFLEPIIIESILDPKDIDRELEYVTNVFEETAN
ncbi:MAG TPA: hypothetical protein VJH71_02320 [Candidatus Paceibacterota bacterium]